MPETSFCGEFAWLCENDWGMRLLSGGTFSPSVQELHPNDRCRKRDYPVHIDSNAFAKASLRTKSVSWWRKLNRLLLADQHTNRGSLESVFLAELVFKKTEVGGRDIVRVTDEQGEDRRLCRDLSHKG